MADWSELPSELLEFISTLTNTSSNIRRFRSVCSSWRSSVTVKPHTHFLSPSIKFSTSQNKNSDVRLVKQTTFLLSLSSDPNSCWMIKTEEHKPGVFSLMSPFSNKGVIKHFDFNCNILDLTNVDIFEVCDEYVMRSVCGSDHINLYDNNMEHEKLAFGYVGEFVNDDNFIILSTHNSTGKLLMYKSNVQEWSFLEDIALGYDDRGDFVRDWSTRYVEVVSYKGRFYAVTDSGRTVVISYGNGDFSVEVDLMVKSIIGGDKKHLVKSGDDLLLVDLYTCHVEGLVEVNAIDVFKLDKEDGKWVLLKSLGGRSIFLSHHSSFSTTSLHGFEGDCIYISLKNLGSDFSEKSEGNLDENGDFDMEDGVENSEIGVFEYEKGYFRSMEENYENSLLCWPPPSWVKILR